MDEPAAATIEQAVAALRRGELVGMPTETVYGLAADASNPDAVRRIFALKGRPAEHPLIVHLGHADDLPRWARTVPAAAQALAAAFWPGPLTLILPRQPTVPDAVTGGQDTVGLRCPAHPLALALLRDLGGGLEAHYAPRTPMLLLGRDALDAERIQQEALGQRVQVLAIGALPAHARGLALPARAADYAHGLYAALRALDAGDGHLLLVERPPQAAEWEAINDRLRRAAVGAAPGDDSP